MHRSKVSRAVRCNLQNITNELLTFLSLHFTLRYVEVVYDCINERVQRKNRSAFEVEQDSLHNS